jgi:hypothetical protein
MAFDKTPSNWLTGYSHTGNVCTFNTAGALTDVTFPELTNAEADEATGDIRKIIFAVLEGIHTKWTATPAADRPSQVTLQRSSVINADNSITHTYTFVVRTIAAGLEVNNEPTA